MRFGRKTREKKKEAFQVRLDPRVNMEGEK